MFEAFTALFVIRRERRKESEPVDVERRKMTYKRAQQKLGESVDRLQSALDRHCQDR